ncbi:MAG: Nif3-like dinuclear metal center hexameric protein [Thiohalocapsa sp.]|jgi:dinuclear metal center YbgI/SA1388 family protein|uniref:Nif3-like dinuclear metal center hexameric protein n=1 Tax=Thiohalocapsa sp. TaxID=2497641 RepID=UPI0025D1999B|nr:Nif3-like dinuclear metal center hexameric protein [Thiohalocapsa sp.]MCG6943387.1 Nif3-like dinuclear metal center hexameric protein [Thiohalocapsa sp.]
MTDSTDIARYCDSLLGAAAVSDYCPNGLQVAGSRPLHRLVSGVTASLALIEAAAEQGADALLVHHGWFWKGEDPRLVGMHGRRVAAVLDAGMALLAYHLPLDRHPEYGNNRRLGEVLGIGGAEAAGEDELIWTGELPAALPGSDFAALVAARLGRRPLHVPVIDRPVRRLAWCTGAAQRFIEQAAMLDVDLYLSGEISEQTVHQARELGLDYVAAGHHATERYGVQALGAHLAERFGLTHRFIDIDNPA